MSAGLDEPIELHHGAAITGPSLAVTVNGMEMPNPFVIGSGPPGRLEDRYLSQQIFPLFQTAFLRIAARNLHNACQVSC